MKKKTLRPWAYHTLEALEGIIIAIFLIVGFCYTFQAMTGFNPLWLIGGR